MADEAVIYCADGCGRQRGFWRATPGCPTFLGPDHYGLICNECSAKRKATEAATIAATIAWNALVAEEKCPDKQCSDYENTVLVIKQGAPLNYYYCPTCTHTHDATLRLEEV